MAISIMAAPISYFTDNNGAPLAGGKIYTYSAGTTTPKDTYTTQGGTIANSNPVILDSAGRAAIWLNGSYKIVVKDSLDNTISTTDNITSVTATGDMTRAVYDAASINQQVVGVSAAQTLTNKTLTSPTITAPTVSNGTFTTPTITGNISKVLAFTYDVSTASGTQTVSSVGFTPSHVEFSYQFTSGGNANLLGWGYSDTTTNATHLNYTSSFTPAYNGSYAIAGQITASSYSLATVSSFTSDGCVLNWTKTASPTGTLTIVGRFFRR